MLARRWESASPLLRRALAPILITGGATTALLRAMLIAEETSCESLSPLSLRHVSHSQPCRSPTSSACLERV